MSEQENTSPHGVQRAKTLTQCSSVPFTAHATNSGTATHATHASQKISVSPTTRQLLQDALSEDQLAQALLPDDGICVILKDEATSSEYEVGALKQLMSAALG